MLAERSAPRARDLLGFSPHRLMTAQRNRPLYYSDGRDADVSIMRSIERCLIALRKAGRRSVFIIDIHCGNGRRLIDAARRARTLGFVAIEARGFDRSAERIAAAAKAAEGYRDPAIGFSFSVRGAERALPLDDEEADVMLAGVEEDLGAEALRVTHRDSAIIRRG